MLALLLGGPPALPADRLHEIAKGETFYSVSRRYGVAVEKLKEANPQVDPNALRTGQKIIIPEQPPAPAPAPAEPQKEEPKPAEPRPSPAEPIQPPLPSSPPLLPPSERPELYLIKKGDTLFKIARDFGIRLEDLKAWNKLADNTLKPGQTLRLKPFEPAASPASLPKPPEILLPISDSAPPAPVPNSEEPKPEPVPEPKPVPVPIPPPIPPKPPDEAVLKESTYLFLKKAKGQIDQPRIKRNRWKYIVIHHSGTANGNAEIFDVNHRKRGMENGLAYHFVIGNGAKGQSDDGGIEVGSRWKKQLQGGHVRSDALNEIAIGICLVGDFDRNRPTKKQIAALIELITYLRDHSNSGRKPVVKMHRDINPSPTDCPGRYFPAKAMYKLFP